MAFKMPPSLVRSPCSRVANQDDFPTFSQPYLLPCRPLSAHLPAAISGPWRCLKLDRSVHATMKIVIDSTGLFDYLLLQLVRHSTSGTYPID